MDAEIWIKTAFPGIYTANDGSNLPELVSSTLKLVRILYPGVLYAFCSNDVKSASWKNGIQIIFAIVDDGAAQEHERHRVIFEGRPFEIRAYSNQGIRLAIRQSIASRRPDLPWVIRSAMVIHNQDQDFEDLQRYVKKCVNTLVPITAVELGAARQQATECLYRLATGTKTQTRQAATNLLFIIPAIFIQGRIGWVPRRLSLAHDILNDFAPELLNSLNDAVATLYREDDSNPLLVLGATILAEMGGPIWQEASRLGTRNGDRAVH